MNVTVNCVKLSLVSSVISFIAGYLLGFCDCYIKYKF